MLRAAREALLGSAQPPVARRPYSSPRAAPGLRASGLRRRPPSGRAPAAGYLRPAAARRARTRPRAARQRPRRRAQPRPPPQEPCPQGRYRSYLGGRPRQRPRLDPQPSAHFRAPGRPRAAAGTSARGGLPAPGPSRCRRKPSLKIWPRPTHRLVSISHVRSLMIDKLNAQPSRAPAPGRWSFVGKPVPASRCVLVIECVGSCLGLGALWEMGQNAAQVTSTVLGKQVEGLEHHLCAVRFRPVPDRPPGRQAGPAGWLPPCSPPQ